MTPEQQEEIENALRLLQDLVDYKELHAVRRAPLETVLQFARQQLTLRVDGEKMDTWLRLWYLNKQEFPTKEEWQAIISERLTTTPEEKDHV